MAIQKNKLRHSPISSALLTSKEFSRIWPALIAANEEARASELVYYEKISDPQTFDKEKTRLGIERSLIIQVGIFGADGEYLQTDNLDDLQTTPIPNRISRMVIDNTTRYHQVTQTFPLNQFKITLDFSVPKIFDFISSPTRATVNDSEIEVLGTNETWVDGTYSQIRKIFEEAKSIAGFIHQHAIYDLLLWLFCIPLMILTLFRFDFWFSRKLSTLSAGLQVIVYLNIFFILLLFFRLFFNYARWLFPYFELDFQKDKKRNNQKTIYVLLLGGLLCSVIYDAVKFLVIR